MIVKAGERSIKFQSIRLCCLFLIIPTTLLQNLQLTTKHMIKQFQVCILHVMSRYTIFYSHQREKKPKKKKKAVEVERSRTSCNSLKLSTSAKPSWVVVEVILLNSNFIDLTIAVCVFEAET